MSYFSALTSSNDPTSPSEGPRNIVENAVAFFSTGEKGSRERNFLTLPEVPTPNPAAAVHASGVYREEELGTSLGCARRKRTHSACSGIRDEIRTQYVRSLQPYLIAFKVHQLDHLPGRPVRRCCCVYLGSLGAL